ncbi:MAG: helix-turn-helix domain-containing protein [Clostridia bacterium]|nr:helix-turn-helix domain-containing protein [Clostridia bacterium]
MTIGETIRKLRRERDITQEGLAEMLGISSQAVSGWETGRTAPDISQLAPLSSIFEVSADVILGIDIDAKSRKIEELYQKAHETACTGDHGTSIRMADDALRQFPDSHKLMRFWANEIYLYNHMTPESEREANEKRALSYLDILRTSPDNAIRNDAVTNSCLWFNRLGRVDEAEALAKSLESYWTSGMLLGKIYKGLPQFQVLRDEMTGSFINAIGYLKDELLECTENDGSPIFSDDERLAIEQMSVDMLKLFIPDGDYMFYAQYAELSHRGMAMIHAKRRDRENTLRCIRDAADMAIHFDTYIPGTPHTSPLLKGMAGDSVWWHDSHNRTHDLIERLMQEDYAFLRGDAEFEAVIEKLKQYAK